MLRLRTTAVLQDLWIRYREACWQTLTAGTLAQAILHPSRHRKESDVAIHLCNKPVVRPLDLLGFRQRGSVTAAIGTRWKIRPGKAAERTARQDGVSPGSR